ncbi:MAG: hypothetical protein ACKON7_07240, partial [Planctomycetaceae bacterium]
SVARGGSPQTFGTVDQLYIVYVAAPEPGSLVSAGIGLGIALSCVRRRGGVVDATGRPWRRQSVPVARGLVAQSRGLGSRTEWLPGVSHSAGVGAAAGRMGLECADPAGRSG